MTSDDATTGSIDQVAREPAVTEPALTVVGVGGSAGALGALLTMLESVDDGFTAAIVVVLHLSPDHESAAVEILQRVTHLSVRQVTSRQKLEPGRVYVIAPGTNLVTEDGHVQPADGKPKRPSTVIDLFFRSLAQAHGERAIGIVLSGTGQDGMLGLEHIKECGGFTIVQSPEDAEYSEMPQAAIARRAVDLVLGAEEIGKRLGELAKRPRLIDPALHAVHEVESKAASSSEESHQQALQDILNTIRIFTRHDFRHYKRPTILRRVERRMLVNRLTNIEAYRDLVRSHPEEQAPLLADLLISVTNFFRDARAFEALQREVIPSLMERAARGEELRCWIPACASGEESYSVAILLHEYAAQMSQPPKVQIFASDINESALAVARAGVYPLNISADVSDAHLLRFFDKEEGVHYRVRSVIREMILFAAHNVLADPPFSRVDLICCRNLLIYLDRAGQAAALDMFAYALNPGGYLMLGNAESIETNDSPFEIVSKEHRIYRLRAGAEPATRSRVAAHQFSQSKSSAALATGAPQSILDKPLAVVHDQALAAASPPNVLINSAYEIERVSPGAGRFVSFGEGVPTRNLFNNVASDVRIELRAALYRASETGERIRAVFRRSDGQGDLGPGVLALTVVPLAGGDGQPARYVVLFDEAVDSALIAAEGDSQGKAPYHAMVEKLEAENRALKLHLQETLDRSAISNEELKASNEELQAINEELRSAKEELETSKEEIQSVNEELTTVNFELRAKVDEAERNNDDLRNFVESSNIATVFVDPGMRVKRFTPEAAKLFSLIPTDVGRSLMDVKSRLEYAEIVEDAVAVFQQLQPVERSIRSVDGEHYLARIFPYRTSLDNIGGAVLTFVNITELRRAQERIRTAEERLRDAIAASSDFAVISADASGQIVSWNEGAVRMFGYTSVEIVGKLIDTLFTQEDIARGVPAEERRLSVRDGRASDERWHVRKDGSVFFCSGVMTPIHGVSGLGFLKIARDVSDNKAREISDREELSEERRHVAEAKAASDIKDQFLAVMSHELKQPLNLIQVNAELLVRLPEHQRSASVQKIGGTILRAVAAQETIVNDLLDMSRVQTGKLRLERAPTDVAELVQRLCQAMTTDLARKEITLDLSVSEPLVCECDRVRIEQVIWNLMGNAVKFTPPGGRICVAVTSDGDCARVEVRDTGAGIAPEFLPRVFELFSQAEVTNANRPGRAGLGIGLALVRELVCAHGGRIEAASPGLGKGTTFTLWIPAIARESEASLDSPAPREFGGRILLVDDDEDSVGSFGKLLEMEGAAVDIATSGAEALRLLERNDYDTILSDIGMPVMSGFEFMNKARTMRPEKKFRGIAITGYGRESDAREALAAGFDAHVSKPVSLEKLRPLLKS